MEEVKIEMDNFYQKLIKEAQENINKGEPRKEEYYLHLDLLKEKAIHCNNFENKVIKDTDHTYWSKEIEIANLIYEWIRKIITN